MQQLSSIITASVKVFGTARLYDHPPGSSNNKRINLHTGELVGLWPFMAYRVCLTSKRRKLSRKGETAKDSLKVIKLVLEITAAILTCPEYERL